jgi:hypothetical protein
LASKYTGFLLLGGIGLWLLLLPGARVWLRRPWPWAGLLLAFLVFSPVLLWNADHGWVSFIKQGGRTGAWQPGRAAGFLLELVGGQFGLATPLVFVLCAWGAWQVGMRAWRARDESETPTRDACALLAALTWLPALVFLQHALGDRVQGNWPAVLYPAGAIAAAALPNRLWRPAAILGFALTALVYVQAATSVFDLPRQFDPTLIRLAGWPALAAEVDTVRRDAGAGFVAADEYGIAAELARELPRNGIVVGAEPRWNLFALPPAGPRIAGRIGILVQSARRATPPDPAPWQSLTQIGVATRGRASNLAETYRLWRVVPREGGADADGVVVLPHPD